MKKIFKTLTAISYVFGLLVSLIVLGIYLNDFVIYLEDYQNNIQNAVYLVFWVIRVFYFVLTPFIYVFSLIFYFDKSFLREKLVDNETKEANKWMDAELIRSKRINELLPQRHDAEKFNELKELLNQYK